MIALFGSIGHPSIAGYELTVVLIGTRCYGVEVARRGESEAMSIHEATVAHASCRKITWISACATISLAGIRLSPRASGGLKHCSYDLTATVGAPGLYFVKLNLYWALLLALVHTG